VRGHRAKTRQHGIDLCAALHPAAYGVPVRHVLGAVHRRHINEFAKHVTAAGVTELAYQEEKAPVIWEISADGSLAGTSYRRISHFVTEPPVFAGAHRHQIADGTRLVQSMTVQPNSNGLSDLLYVCTYAVGGTDYAVEVLRPIFEDA